MDHTASGKGCSFLEMDRAVGHRREGAFVIHRTIPPIAGFRCGDLKRATHASQSMIAAVRSMIPLALPHISRNHVWVWPPYGLALVLSAFRTQAGWG